MDWKELTNLNGINWWLLLSGGGINFIWASGVLIWALQTISEERSTINSIQVWLLLGLFLGPFLVGLMLGKWAADGRGPTYGIISTIISLGVIGYALIPNGIIGLLALMVHLMGGLNGGLLSQPRGPSPGR